MTVFLGLVTTTALAFAAGDPVTHPPLLLQHPSLSATSVVFDYAGEIWKVPRSGGRAERLVTGQGQLSGPIFSPDGTRVAYTGRYDGNTDVYVVAAHSGEPRRLTWHPGADVALAWTPDGKSILFRSPAKTARDLDQLYLVPAGGGPERELPLPSGESGSFSPDAARLAYAPFLQWEPAWKRYRGGQTARLWIADLATSHTTAVPRDNSNDRNPMWVGDTLYFLSDRDGPTTLYAYDTKSGAVTRRIDNAHGFDMASAGAGPGGIVIDAFGQLEIFDTATGAVHALSVTIDSDLPQLRPHYEPVKPEMITTAMLTASGKRVILAAHGDIFSAPSEKGEIRNLTHSPGVADRDPAPSPDGKSIAWFSDESGEYALHIGPAEGSDAVRKIGLGQPPSFFYQPRWSPDSRKIVFHDKRLNLWIVDVADGQVRKIATDRFDNPAFAFDPAWSADSRWIVYLTQLPNHLHAASVYSLETGRSTQLTSGESDVGAPRFDRGGKYLYFTASTSVGRGAGWLDMSSLGRAIDGAVYVMVLRKDTPSPVAPESDEENAADAAPPGPATATKKTAAKPADAASAAATPAEVASGAKANTPPVRVTIDFEDLDQRILALPIPRANFAGLEVGKEGIVYTLTAPAALSDDDLLDAGEEGSPATLFRFDLKDRKNTQLVDGVKPGSFSISADGGKMLFGSKTGWKVSAADAPVKSGMGDIKLDKMTVWVDPPAEWRQMFDETWRIERDFFYDPKLHGLPLERAKALYARYLPGIAARQDLNTLLEEMTGQIEVGHMFVRGGMLPQQRKAMVGLLGADYEIVDGHWRIARILRGENWNPKLVAPLSQPGVAVRAGDFLLAVDGRPVTADEPIDRFLDGTAGTQVLLRVGPHADGSGAHDVTVIPVASETQLRLRDWMEANRRKVDALSSGRLAYVYLPDTQSGGFANFNRYYYAQVGKQGVILDERFNHGGDIPDSIIDELKRTPQMLYASREGETDTEPAQAIFGPKVMIINEMSGSGGDALPWLFQKNSIGPLVGERTWGGLVGIGGYPALLDGGTVQAPRWAFYGTRGQWEVENIGIAPDVEVRQDPELVRQGHDPQLERAVAEALALLAKHPPQKFPVPAYPDKHPVLPQ